MPLLLRRCGLCLLPTVVFLSLAQVPPSGRDSTFEVASVKLNKTDRVGRLGPVINPERLSWRGATLKQLIGEAYSVEYAQISGAPAWSDTEAYDVDAKAEKPATHDQLRKMLRELLADRFKLTVQAQKKTMQIYVLSAARTGVKLREISAEDQSKPDDKPVINQLHRRASMAKFVALLSQMIGGPIFNGYTGRLEPRQDAAMVVDETGLTGVYDVNLALDSTTNGDFMATLQDALSSVGLRIDLKPRPVDVISVIHAERLPTDN